MNTIVSEPKSAPLYQQLASDLRAKIQSGSFGRSCEFPTEASLCAQTGFSRGTVRQALQCLENDGLILRCKGARTKVRPLVCDKEPLRQPTASRGKFRSEDAHGQLKLEQVSIARLPDQLRPDYDPSGLQVWHSFTGIERGPDEGSPCGIATYYLPNWLVNQLPSIELSGKSLPAQVQQEAGSCETSIRQTIEAVRATPIEAQKLQTTVSAPLLRVTNAYLWGDEHVALLSISTYCGHAIKQSMVEAQPAAASR